MNNGDLAADRHSKAEVKLAEAALERDALVRQLQDAQAAHRELAAAHAALRCAPYL